MALLDIILYTCIYMGQRGIPKYSEELINLRVSMEERLFETHLCKDASNAPHIYRAGIARRAQQHLWRPVPQSHNLCTTKHCIIHTHTTIDKMH